MYLMKRALVLSLAVVLGLGIASFAQTLSGEWITTITIDPQAATVAAFLDFDTELTVIYEVGGWAFTSYSALDDTGWYDQTFSAEGSLGAWTFGSTVDFDPTGAFEELVVETGIALGGMSFGVEFTLADKDVTLVLTGSGSTSLVDIDIEITFGGDDNDLCDLDWAGVTVDVTFPFCCADVTASIEFDCYGFQEACFGVSGIVIPNLPWVTIGAEVCFQTESKTLTLTPAFDFGADVCFDLYITDPLSNAPAVGPATPLVFGDFQVSGIGLECEIGGVAFTGISYYGPAIYGPYANDYPGLLAGYGQQYWEAYQIATTDDACCGPFSFDIAVFFDATSTNLFDIALFVANMELVVAPQFTFGMGLTMDVIAGLTNWSLSFIVTW
jgi:hypothetical protein